MSLPGIQKLKKLQQKKSPQVQTILNLQDSPTLRSGKMNSDHNTQLQSQSSSQIQGESEDLIFPFNCSYYSSLETKIFYQRLLRLEFFMSFQARQKKKIDFIPWSSSRPSHDCCRSSFFNFFIFQFLPPQSTGRWSLVPNGGVWFRPRMRLEDALYCF